MEDVWTVPMHENTRAINFIESVSAYVFTLLNDNDGSSFCGMTLRNDRPRKARSNH